MQPYLTFIFLSRPAMYVKSRKENVLRKFSYLKKNKFEAHRCVKALASSAQVSTDRVATSVAEDHERMRHATRIVFSHLISAACRCRSLRSQVLGLLFARQKVATAETARRCMYVTASVRMRVHIFDVHPIFLFPIVWF